VTPTETAPLPAQSNVGHPADVTMELTVTIREFKLLLQAVRNQCHREGELIRLGVPNAERLGQFEFLQSELLRTWYDRTEVLFNDDDSDDEEVG